MVLLSDIKYPLELDESTGNLRVVYDREVRRQNIKSLIETIKKERVMNPEYGSYLYLFEVLPNTALVNFRLKQAIEAYIPDITVEIRTTLNQAGELLIIIDWIYLPDTSQATFPIEFTLSF